LKKLPPEIYDRDYFLSDRCEGFEYFQGGELSAVKRYELEQLQVGPGIRVLDAGCGRGEMLKACADAGAEVAGVDYSEAAVALTKETLAGVKGADIRQGEFLELPWPDASFDRILFGDVIEHLDPADAAGALREFRRVLRPGGFVLVHTAPNRLFRKVTWPVLRPLAKVAAREAAAKRDDYLADVLNYHVNEQTLGSLRRSMKAAGFDDVKGWIDPDVIRGGSHQLTRGLERNPLVKVATKVASLRPVRAFLGNDLYVRGRKSA
jgi:ubiquinone/menaquinone biosynthesis C-methylase UbiE